MKKLLRYSLLSFVIVSVCVSCSTGDSKVHKIAEDYLKSQIDNPESVKDVQFGSVDTLYQSYIESPEGKAARARIDSVQGYKDHLASLYNRDLEKELAVGAKVDSLWKNYEKMSETYKGKQVGWKIDVMFTANDKDGNPKRDTLSVHLNLACDQAVGLYRGQKKVYTDKALMHDLENELK